ncbi:CDP-diacylglycerol--serine O-phosphatidyltransferase [Cytophagaceae bacterium DM2B3-1]|uniref:CDP-diacylglycerol--serine O-phosphatidyltransferase n=1 Tax=Xanthocytophaga flava TaxID=3048013 RepID=A0AAE3QNG2_9BACT|nr:CDP-diacylglycerol--serine O-phosphatidyltransferase [Xanthocytophaga flavus]MDJ1480146.1 CDP-diacylglycerol--serine O-phosphatidyltransferase [Xanthocytophaga flavus]MDJ1495618.1 CDP-diacylglycerol--serine O-phosphatidyltransferase [Xanthocytophaga flavus]
MKRHIPNIFTCGNLFCGCVGIVSVFQNDLNFAAYMIGLAAVLDFGDGFAARILKSHSAIGKELDSLADCVTFGVLPGVILYKLLQRSLMHDDYSLVLFVILPYMAYLITIFSALRLAKFNVDTRQTDSFIGVPTPANALFVGALPLILWQHPQWSTYILNPIVLCGYILIMSFLMTSEIPLFALKFKDFSIANNKVRYLFLLLSLGLIIFLQFAALPLIIVLYILLSVIKF